MYSVFPNSIECTILLHHKHVVRRSTTATSTLLNIAGLSRAPKSHVYYPRSRCIVFDNLAVIMVTAAACS